MQYRVYKLDKFSKILEEVTESPVTKREAFSMCALWESLGCVVMVEAVC